MTTPTEREALIAALRTLRPSPAECDLAADMLAADAQEIELLKEKVAYEQALGDKHFAAHTRLQAELEGIRKQEPACPACQAPGLTYECVACSVSNYPAAGAQQVVGPQGWQLIDADQMREILRDIHQHVQQGHLSEEAAAKLDPGYGTGIYAHIWHQMHKLSAMLAAAPHPPQSDYAALEREHLGDPDLKTGIYAPHPPQAERVPMTEDVELLVRTTRKQAFEDAAKLCDEQASEPECQERATYCAAAIRELK